MAVETKDKKRKAASSSGVVETHPPSKKSKKSAAKTANLPTKEKTNTTVKDKKAIESTNGKVSKPTKLSSAPARDVKPRKRAADFLSDDEDGTVKNDKKNSSKEQKSESVKPAKKKAKEDAKPTSIASKPKDHFNGTTVTANTTSATKPPRESKPSANDDEGSDDEGDQTVALIRGFESSGEEDVSGDEGFEPGQDIPQIPDSKQVKRKLRKLKKSNSDEPEKPGTVYIGRVPHGFYENEMRAYFSQFGEINLLRLSRNRTTGRSKHFGYIQFASDSVAKVVADTMDNYLMFGHILKCKFVPEDQLHPETFKGANRRFKMVPWNRIEKKTLEAGNTRTQWSKKIEKEEAKRVAKAEKMKALGYEIDLPALTSVDEVPVQKTLNEKPPSENSIIEPFKAIEAVEPPGKDELKKPKKPKRGKDVVNADSTKETLPDPVKELVPEKSTKVQQSDGKETAEKNDKDLKKEKKKKTKKASGPTADDIGKQSNAVETKTKPVKQKETKVKAKKGEQVEPSKKKQKKTEA